MHPRRGAEAIEFALILPVFVLLLSSMIDYGWLFYQRMSVLDAVRVGVRAGVVVPYDGVDRSDAIAEAEQGVTGRLEAWNIDCGSGSDCQVDCSSQGENPREVLSCTTTVGYEPLVGFLPRELPGGASLYPESISATVALLFELQR